MQHLSPKPTQLIGLYSPAARSGKTAVSRVLERTGYVRIPFAEPMKLMLHPLLRELGYTQDEVAHRLYSAKEELIDSLGITTRHLLQTLGTEWGRQCVRPDMWLRVWKQRVSKYAYVVVDDVRFENEAELIRSLGGEVWHITRPGIERSCDHASEGGLDTWPHFSRYIVNNGTLEELTNAVVAIPFGKDGTDSTRGRVAS